MPKQIVLASTSPWRLQLLRDTGIDCLAVAPEVDEEVIGGADPVSVAMARARAKAVDVAARRRGALVCGADQVVHLDGEIVGKPADEDAWMARLQGLRGRVHALTTAVALVRLGEPGDVDDAFSVSSRVRFRADLEDQELRAYVAMGEARGCAGGYMVERRGAWLVESVEGDWLNVVGLPVLHLLGRLRALGWRLEEEG